MEGKKIYYSSIKGKVFPKLGINLRVFLKMPRSLKKRGYTHLKYTLNRREFSRGLICNFAKITNLIIQMTSLFASNWEYEQI